MDRQLERLIAAVAATSRQLQSVIQQGARLMSAIDELRAEVEEAKTVSASAIALIGGLKEKLDAAVASGDMSQVEALVADLDANNKQLADAVTANTPSDPAAPSATGGPSTQPDPSTPPDPNA